LLVLFVFDAFLTDALLQSSSLERYTEWAIKRPRFLLRPQPSSPTNHLQYSPPRASRMSLPNRTSYASTMSFYFVTNVSHTVSAGPRRISHVVFQPGVYKRNPNIRAYIEHRVIQECKRAGGLDSQGANFAIMQYVHLATLANSPDSHYIQAVRVTTEAQTRTNDFIAPFIFMTLTAIVC
jgi:hypothetical protein